MRPASSLPPGDRLTGIARGAGVERARPTQRQYAAKNSLFSRFRVCCEFLEKRTSGETDIRDKQAIDRAASGCRPGFPAVLILAFRVF